ncbi:MAG TPA: uracil-DNA glycosylase [Acidimicrobiales bacterium]|nr:uracil-DNA glycosylase [Acidimicrobiales bacterium]
MPTLALVEADAKACVACPLAATRTQVVFARGDGSSGLMFVGEAPGRDEDLQGAPFVGRSGQLLDRLVAEELGLARDEYYVANVVKCRPPGNRDPLPEEIAACHHFLDAQIGEVAPRVIVTLGNFATRYLLATTEGITRLRGRSYPYRDGIEIVPTFHPSAALRSGGAVVADMRADLIRAKRALAR